MCAGLDLAIWNYIDCHQMFIEIHVYPLELSSHYSGDDNSWLKFRLIQ